MGAIQYNSITLECDDCGIEDKFDIDDDDYTVKESIEFVGWIGDGDLCACPECKNKSKWAKLK